MAIMNKVTSGADLTHPKIEGGWMIGATFGLMAFMAVFMAAAFIWNWIKGVASSKVKVPAGASSGLKTSFASLTDLRF